MREKDGLWAVLLWLDILAARRQPVAEIVREHWARFGRNYYSRHDYEEIPSAAAEGLMDGAARARCRGCRGSASARSPSRRRTISATTTRSTARSARSQGIRLLFADGARIVYRLSGTGTAGATLRVYLERYEPDPTRHDQDPQAALAPLIALADQIAGIRARTGRAAPSVIT